MKEILIEDDHILKARKLGAVCIKGDFKGRAAWPDQLILKPVGYYWIEFKSETGTLQDDQVEMHKLLRKKGHTVYVCDNKYDSDYIICKEFKLNEVL